MILIDGRTLVPLRFISEAFEVDVEWDGTTRTAVLTEKQGEIMIKANEIYITVNLNSRTVKGKNVGNEREEE